jgi:hypothetical protein
MSNEVNSKTPRRDSRASCNPKYNLSQISIEGHIIAFEKSAG